MHRERKADYLFRIILIGIALLGFAVRAWAATYHVPLNSDINTDSSAFTIDSEATSATGISADFQNTSGDLLNLGVNKVEKFAVDYTGAVTGLSYSGDGSTLTNVGIGAATALTILSKVNEGAGITKGQAVYVSGATGNMPQVSLADNTVDGKHHPFGIAAETAANNTNILIRVAGEVTTLNTLAWSIGDHLYLSTAGALINTVPTSGAIIEIGHVTTDSATVGRIVVNVRRVAQRGVTSGVDLYTRLGDDIGGNSIAFRNYSNEDIANIDSLGNFSLIATSVEMRFYEGANYIGFEAPALDADQIWVLPDADGDADQVLKTDGGGNLGWAAAAGGYTDLTEFVDQTAWRLFYSNASGDVVELAFGADGTYLMSNGATSAPTFETPSGATGKFKIGLLPAGANLTGQSTEPELSSIDGTNFDYDVLLCDDTTTETCYYVIPGCITDDYGGGDFTIKIRWMAVNTYNDVVWRVKLLGRSAGEAFDSAMVAGENFTASTANGTTLYMTEASKTITAGATKLTAGDTWVIAFARLATDATDTLTGDAMYLEANITED